ncbi:Lipoprotein-releasing system ATP-binding protein LolD [Pseudoalteromonas holothuriae]|uniref:Lipoprotein-releasing system ATP-binding protein LolD n=1 Tax=Pseudoalteromonas holothuriae TaxID=2963714 RepID=A0A9W4QUB1_9GAMM|nr:MULTISPECIES: ABC transporter ATP-binding protein [unclassified Pseudoalteromonas]CAH9053917.1 Lipoprotein-releasing system ATP-binding protein LolD [Pseudoalteromonas sp. CIP111854]CAH9064417.1 Lipoprotein-releasing system ATP-binding protein LolD [Pseudoalteromonas sp. CIP111951]
MHKNSGITLTASALCHQVKVNAGDTLSLINKLSLSIKSAEQIAITGASGSGKSTLLSLLAGLENIQQGTLTVEHQGISVDDNYLRQHSGFVFQQFHLLPELDAINNVALPLKLRAVKNADEQAAQWLENVGLSHRKNQPISKLSGGEQQRVAIARAFVNQPSIIFADEPTGNLDEQTAGEVASLMCDFARKNHTTLVLVTHNLALAKQLDSQYCLVQGALEKCE